MARTKSKQPKVNAFYRLPETLVRRIKLLAVKRDVDPCVVAEELLVNGLKRQPKAEQDEPDSTPAGRPAAATA